MFIMVADRSHQEKTFRIEKKYCEIQKNISESKKKENIKLKSRKKFQNQEIFCYKNREKILNSMTSNSMNLPANIYLFEVSNRNTRKKCERCSKLIIKTPERR